METRNLTYGDEAEAIEPLGGPMLRIHAALAFAASIAGFVASYIYLLRAAADGGAWALKMAYHMAAWHGLLVLVLAPLSLLFGTTGLRIVQWVCALFFAIHVGIGFTNAHGTGTGAESHATAIAIWNLLSAVCFAAAVPTGSLALPARGAKKAESFPVSGS